MKAYIGAKIVLAEPLGENDWLKFRGSDLVNNPRSGYKVVYPDNYVSWSPRDTFEEAYRAISDKEKELINTQIDIEH